jgi:hypothetical protein
MGGTKAAALLDEFLGGHGSNLEEGLELQTHVQ